MKKTQSKMAARAFRIVGTLVSGDKGRTLTMSMGHAVGALVSGDKVRWATLKAAAMGDKPQPKLIEPISLAPKNIPTTVHISLTMMLKARKYTNVIKDRQSYEKNSYNFLEHLKKSQQGIYFLTLLYKCCCTASH